MGSLVTLGLAANIVQFVHFGTTLLPEASNRHCSTSGATIAHTELEVIANNLKQLSLDLEVSWAESSPQQLGSELVEIYEQCGAVSKELVAVLDHFKVQGKHKRWASFTGAAKSFRKEKRIESVKKKLNDLQHDVLFYLMAEMK
jgi:cob(I)alamin adenosyltransferase